MNLTNLLIGLAAGSSLTTISSAQSLPVAYPQDSISISQGAVFPLGYFSGVANTEERRAQMVVPASWLPPTGATITGIAFRANAPGAVTYDSLRIAISHSATTNLDIVFDNNLNAPQVVEQATNLTVNWVSNQWTEIPFSTPFSYDGQSHLVIELQMVVNPSSSFCSHQIVGNPQRNDLPLAPVATGALGSGTNLATAGQFMAAPLQFRLLVAGAPTMTLLSNRGGAQNNTFAIGTTVSVNINTNAPAGQLYGTLIDLGYQAAPVTIAPLGGEAWVLGSTLFLGTTSGVVDTNGFSLPNNPALVNLPVAMQSVVIDLNTLVGGFTNAADFIVRS